MTRALALILAAGLFSSSTVVAQQGGRDADASRPAQPSKTTGDAKAQPELPPGMSAADMQAMMQAATPGEKHAYLARTIGSWDGKIKMWMTPDSEPQLSQCIQNNSSLFDGRFVKSELNGEMPGMGPFNGFALYGYDNVSEQYQGTWVDNFGTGMMTGTGKSTADGRGIEWQYTYNCPITKGQKKMRAIERMTGPNSMSFEMHGESPEGEEFKMMQIDYTRRRGDANRPGDAGSDRSNPTGATPRGTPSTPASPGKPATPVRPANPPR